MLPIAKENKQASRSDFSEQDPDLKQLQDMISFLKSNQAMFKTQSDSIEILDKKKELNFDEQSVLEDLRRYRLTAEMLANRNKNGHRFSFLHAEALRYLVIAKRLKISIALKGIDGVSSAQAAKIADGLDPKEVKKLDNCWFKKRDAFLDVPSTRHLSAARDLVAGGPLLRSR